MPTPPRRGSEDPAHRLPVYILAGGQSRRFGSDKARALLDGVPMMVRVAETLGPIAQSVTIVVKKAGDYADLRFRTIVDVVPGGGPMGGLLTAIEDSRAGGWIFVSACDWVGVKAVWVRALMDGVQPPAEAVVFRSRQVEPLFGLYHCSIRGVVADWVSRGDLKMQDLLSRIETTMIPAPPGWEEVRNINRPNALP